MPDGPLGLVGREPETDETPQEPAQINPLIRPGETPDDAAARIMRDVRAKTAARTREEEAGKRLIQSLVPGPIYGEEAQ